MPFCSSHRWAVACFAAGWLLFAGGRAFGADGAAARTNEARPQIPSELMNPSPAAGPAPSKPTPPQEANPATFDAMLEFNKEFLPLIVEVAGTNQSAMREQMAKVMAAWPVLAKHCATNFPNDPRLATAMGEAQEGLQQLQKSLAEGRLAAARTNLEEVALGLMRQRVRLGLDYMPDYLLRYSQALNFALATAAPLNPTNVMRADLIRLRDYCIAARSLWQQFLTAPRPDPTRYQFSSDMGLELNAAGGAAVKAMQDMENVFEQGDPAAMLESVRTLQSAYLRLLMAFVRPPEPPAQPPTPPPSAK